MTLADYERELSAAMAMLEAATVRKNAAAIEEEELKNVVQGWQAIVARERRKSGQEGPEFEARSTLALNVSGNIEGATLAETDDEEEGENKTQFVRDQIRQNVNRGTTVSDLKAAAKASGMQHPSSWPYGVLTRLKKRGEVVKRRGKFYPKPTQSDLALVG